MVLCLLGLESYQLKFRTKSRIELQMFNLFLQTPTTCTKPMLDVRFSLGNIKEKSLFALHSNIVSEVRDLKFQKQKSL